MVHVSLLGFVSAKTGGTCTFEARPSERGVTHEEIAGAISHGEHG